MNFAIKNDECTTISKFTLSGKHPSAWEAWSKKAGKLLFFGLLLLQATPAYITISAKVDLHSCLPILSLLWVVESRN